MDACSQHSLTAVAALPPALLHTVRLARWRGWRTWPEMLLVILHVAYAFVPLGFAAISIGALGFVEERSVMHVLTVGAIAAMMLSGHDPRAAGHTGYRLPASRFDGRLLRRGRDVGTVGAAGGNTSRRCSEPLCRLRKRVDPGLLRCSALSMARSWRRKRRVVPGRGVGFQPHKSAS